MSSHTSNYTNATKDTEKINTARVFVRAGAAVMSDIECDAAVTSGMLASSGGWVQIETLDGIEVNYNRTAIKTKSDQKGTKKIFIDEDDVEVVLHLSKLGIDDLAYLANIYGGLDPDTNDNIPIKSNSGADLSESGFTIYAYPLDCDKTNNTNTPKIGTGVTGAILLFNCVNTSNVSLKYTKDQNKADLTLSPLPSVSAGSANGISGLFGGDAKIIPLA